jgi:hypothetical protein
VRAVTSRKWPVPWNFGSYGNFGNFGNAREAAPRPPSTPGRLKGVRVKDISLLDISLLSATSTRTWRESRARPGASRSASAGTDTAATLTAWHAWTRTARAPRHWGTASAGRIRRTGVNELPFVVVTAALVESDRRFLALAHDTEDPTRTNLRTESTGGWRLPRRRRRRPAPAATIPNRCLDVRADIERLELAVRRHRIFVFFSEEPLLHEDVEVRRPGTRAHLSFPPADRADVLFAPEDKLRFLFALGLVAPGRKDRRHHYGHHPQGDQQPRHGVATLDAALVLTL